MVDVDRDDGGTRPVEKPKAPVVVQGDDAIALAELEVLLNQARPDQTAGRRVERAPGG